MYAPVLPNDAVKFFNFDHKFASSIRVGSLGVWMGCEQVLVLEKGDDISK